jgi:RHH-type proline utilization regulon transcriptional repressor/proline dehydrogenase/delta 1-pyrroline-5-carboxylate dehydrogenase
VGEQNLYSLHPRGCILLCPETREGLFAQMAAVLATSNRGVVEGMALPEGLPASVASIFSNESGERCAAVLVEGGAARVMAMAQRMAAMPGPIVPVHAAVPDRQLAYPVEWLLEEVSISINTTAAGGNASLMMIG